MSPSDSENGNNLQDLVLELRVREHPRLGNAEHVEKRGDSSDASSTEELIETVRSLQKVVYGPDNRQDLFAVTDPAVLNSADSVLSLWNAASITDNGDGTSTLNTQNFGTSRNLCAGEPFRNQPIGAFCSGFLVAPDTVATAGHCVDANDVADARFVFGYRMADAANAQTVVDNSQIYRGIAIIGHQLTTGGADWSLVRLDRTVADHRTAPIRRAGTIANDQGLYVIGHPVGLPIKYAPGANVRDNAAAAFFVANLDTYGGNSGSPVFNADSHEVEGILVRGETDFVLNGTCRVSLVCPNTGCRGEDSTRTTEFSDLVPSTSTGGRIMIADFSSGQVPATVRYWENWGQHPLFGGWHDDNDWIVVGDFMNLGYDQLMSLNRTDSGDGRIMIADFSSGQVPATVRYWENWGQHPLFGGWHDDNDRIDVGRFSAGGPATLLSINRSA
jgi:hypothetical protein